LALKPLALGGVRRALVVAPHPDDEVIGAFGLVRRLRRAGASVRVAIVSDGAASHPASRQWPPARLAAERRAESRRAAARLGLAAGDLDFLGMPDGGLDALDADGRLALDRAVRRARADLLVLPDAGDDHPDHRAVAALVARVATPGARRLACLPPQREDRRAPVARGLRLGRDAAVKRALIACFRTQRGGVADDPSGFVIDGPMLARFSRPVERYRVLR
jgi:LmbE family N-acetylglucosaminyl deacetylase